MTSTLQTRTAREYQRVSQDRSGKARSTHEQHTDNAEAADDNGWQLGEPYLDVDRSASRYATKVREGYDQLVADLAADRFGADVLILWESSRGSRKVSEWVVLLELLEERGVLVHVTTHDRTYDPSIPRDRKSLLEDSVDSEYESAKTSKRGRRAAAASAAAGVPNGRVPYGYKRDYEYVTKDGKQVRIIHQTPDEDTAPLIRELFDRVKGGHSLRAIQRDWSARGILNRSGKPYSAQHLRSFLLTRAYVGDRVHNPGDKSGNAARANSPASQIVPGQWEPLVDRATFKAVQDILAAPERRTTRPGRGVHLLSMIALCGECGGPLTVRLSKQPDGEYTCHRGSHVRVSKPELDEFVERVFLDYLARPEMYGQLVAAETDPAALAKAKAERDDIKAELDDLGDQLGSGAISATLAARAERGIEQRLKAASKRVKELETPSRLRDLIEPGPGVAKRWAAAPMSTKRELARLLLSPDALGELRIMRRPRDAGPRHVPVEERTTWGRLPETR